MAGFNDEEVIYRGPTGVANQGTAGGSGTYYGGMGVIANTGFSGVSAFDFDGSNDYLDIGTVSTATTFSVGFWVNFRRAPDARLINYVVGMGTTTGIFWGGTYAPINDKYGVSAPGLVLSTTDADQLTWRLIVINITGTSVAIYRDGVADGTGTLGSTLSPQTVNIGRRPDNNWYSLAYVDDVRISTTLRTTGEISDWYSAGRGYDTSSGAPAQNAQNNNMRNIRMAP